MTRLPGEAEFTAAPLADGHRARARRRLEVGAGALAVVLVLGVAAVLVLGVAAVLVLGVAAGMGWPRGGKDAEPAGPPPATRSPWLPSHSTTSTSTRGLDLPVSVDEMVEILEDPRFGLVTTADAVAAGDHLPDPKWG